MNIVSRPKIAKIKRGILRNRTTHQFVGEFGPNKYVTLLYVKAALPSPYFKPMTN